MTLYRLKKFKWDRQLGGAWRATVPTFASVHPPDDQCDKWHTWTPTDGREVWKFESAAEAMAAVERAHYAEVLCSLEPAQVTP